MPGKIINKEILKNNNIIAEINPNNIANPRQTMPEMPSLFLPTSAVNALREMINQQNQNIPEDFPFLMCHDDSVNNIFFNDNIFNDNVLAEETYQLSGDCSLIER